MGYHTFASSALLVACFAAVAYSKYTGFFFGGPFLGHCGPDGYYYGDATHFVQCSGGIAYHQSCAPGTQNSQLQQYKQGYYKSVTIFCDVNLNDALNSPPEDKKEEVVMTDAAEAPMEDEDVMEMAAGETEEKAEDSAEVESMDEDAAASDDEEAPKEEEEPSEEEPMVEAPEMEPTMMKSQPPAAPVPMLARPYYGYGHTYPYYGGYYPYNVPFPYDNPYYAKYIHG